MNKSVFLQTFGRQMGAVLQTGDGTHSIGLRTVGGIRKRYLNASGAGGGFAGRIGTGKLE